MKQQLALPDFVAQIRSDRDNKRDFLLDTRAMQYLPSGQVMFEGDQSPLLFSPTNPAARQVGEHCGIPAKYFDRMKNEAPDLLAQNINHWLQNGPTTQMVRTVGKNMRAFLSKRYRPLDNADCTTAVVPLLEQFGAQIKSCAVTETRMYLKAIIPGKAVELKAPGTQWGVGHDKIHVLHPGIVISNSETGHGSVAIQPGVHEDHCSNLMVMSEKAMRKLHVQKGTDVDEGVTEYLTDETRRKQDAAFWATVRDLATAALDGRIFDQYVEQIRTTMGHVIPQPKATVELMADKYNLTNDERDSVLDRLMQSGEPTQFGLQAAVTLMAQDVESYDRASELERLGGRIIELPKSDWEQLAAAA